MYRLLLNSNIHFISFDVKVQDREPRPGMLVIACEAWMCFQTFEEEELPWMRNKAGWSFFRAVSEMEIRPCSVSNVKALLVIVVRWGRCLGFIC